MMVKMQYIVDRIEEHVVMLEANEGDIFSINKKYLPKGIKEGDVLRLDVDDKATHQRKKRIESLMDELWAD